MIIVDELHFLLSLELFCFLFRFYEVLPYFLMPRSLVLCSERDFSRWLFSELAFDFDFACLKLSLTLNFVFFHLRLYCGLLTRQDHYTAMQPGLQRMVLRLEELVQRIDGEARRSRNVLQLSHAFLSPLPPHNT